MGTKEQGSIGSALQLSRGRDTSPRERRNFNPPQVPLSGTEYDVTWLTFKRWRIVSFDGVYRSVAAVRSNRLAYFFCVVRYYHKHFFCVKNGSTALSTRLPARLPVRLPDDATLAARPNLDSDVEASHGMARHWHIS